MTALDYLQTDNLQGARDTIALLAVMLEQAVMDGGRLVLVLQDDLPASIFVNRQAGALSRSRSFSPLADQKWITTALAYLKELDTIQGKRLELANPGKPSTEPSKAQPKPKGGPRRKGGQKGSQKTEEEEEQ